MKKCFGEMAKTNQIKNSQQFIDAFFKRKDCLNCDLAYNCLILTSINYGLAENEELNQFLKTVKLNSIFQRLKNKHKQKAIQVDDEVTINVVELSINEILNEFNKRENQELKKVFIEKLKQQYYQAAMVADSTLGLLEQLGVDIEND